MKLDIVRDTKDSSKNFYVTYYLEGSSTLLAAAEALAIGQSYGNPVYRSIWETSETVERFCAKIIKNDNLLNKSGNVEIEFPLELIDWKTDGIAQLMCIIAGGQADIDIIKKCRILKIEFHDEFIKNNFNKPTYGLSGLRDRTGNYTTPFLGGILKPKTGCSPQVLLDMTAAMVDGGCSFIKEDEILSNPSICKLEDRVELISKYISNTNVIYSFCINSDPAHLLPRAQFVADNGGTGVHVNVWSGLGAYKSIRDMNLPLWIHYQKSGDKFFTHRDNPFSVSWQVCCQLAAWCGVDTIHAGMWGGYLSDPEDELRETMKILTDGNVVPALSCGLVAESIQPIVDKFGINWMGNSGGGIHSHPQGSTAGARKIRNAIDAVKNR